MRDAEIPDRHSSDAGALPPGALARLLPGGLENALAEIEALRQIWLQQPNADFGDRLADWLSEAVRAEYRQAAADNASPTSEP